MTREPFGQIIHLIEKTLGLKSHFVNSLVWECLLKERMNLNRLSTYEDYLKKLQTSVQELQELIELVVIPETWFFRDKSVYTFLTNFIRKKNDLLPSKPSLLKILSIPCSTGEEPYSIAMALFDQGMSKESFMIDAVDISKKALTKAQMGVYKKKSFRGKDLGYRDRYFNEISEGYAIKALVKDQVRFHYFNILDEKLPFEPHSYQLIFFRNLLIYLNPNAQAQAFKIIKECLAPQGVVIVGRAETTFICQHGFSAEKGCRGYAFSLENSKLNHLDLFKSAPNLAFNQLIHKIKELNNKYDENLINKENLIFNLEALDFDEKFALIQEATKLADSHCFEESTNLCLRYINKFGAHAHVYYLLGLMQHAIGHEERAEEFFNKTIYLQPMHYEALVYLALLCEKKGEKHQAELFRQRAQNIHKTL